MIKMLIRNRVVTLDRVESTGWAKIPDLSTPKEHNVLTAYFSDGTTKTKTLTVSYKDGERERILEAMVSGVEADKALDSLVKIKLRRARLVQKAHGDWRREYRNGVVIYG